jgi:hypothetical protein
MDGGPPRLMGLSRAEQGASLAGDRRAGAEPGCVQPPSRLNQAAVDRTSADGLGLPPPIPSSGACHCKLLGRVGRAVAREARRSIDIGLASRSSHDGPTDEGNLDATGGARATANGSIDAMERSGTAECGNVSRGSLRPAAPSAPLRWDSHGGDGEGALRAVAPAVVRAHPVETNEDVLGGARCGAPAAPAKSGSWDGMLRTRASKGQSPAEIGSTPR